MSDGREDAYRPWSGRPPGYLAGRDPHLEGFQILVDRIGHGLSERSIVYSSHTQSDWSNTAISTVSATQRPDVR